ncbi:MAG: T9SS type A sorting domain-containing protein [Bacteroidetes bacterium]|nr:T9SS type A sorting domain-containing protein [Bacteroidota bacterium]
MEIVLGEEKQKKPIQKLLVYPNPFTNELMIELDAKNLQLSIYDNLGRLVHLQKIESMGKINLSALPSGVYFLRVISQNGEIHSEKLIKTE